MPSLKMRTSSVHTHTPMRTSQNVGTSVAGRDAVRFTDYSRSLRSLHHPVLESLLVGERPICLTKARAEGGKVGSCVLQVIVAKKLMDTDRMSKGKNIFIGPPQLRGLDPTRCPTGKQNPNGDPKNKRKTLTLKEIYSSQGPRWTSKVTIRW